MLDLFTSKKNKIVKPLAINISEKTSKHFPSPLREWKNSIYVYNKNSLNLIPSTTISTNNFIKSYFNLFNKSIEVKMRTKRLLLRLRRLSSNKYYISNGGFKHTNNKVLINLYVFNRQKKNYILTLKKWYIQTFFKTKNELRKTNTSWIAKNRESWKKHWNLKKTDWNNNKGWNERKLNIRKVIWWRNSRSWRNKSKSWNKPRKINRNVKTMSTNLIKRFNMITTKGIESLRIYHKDKYLLINTLNKVSKNKNFKTLSLLALSEYMANFYKKLIKKSLRKIKMYFFYKQLLYINRSKLNYTYLQYLKKHLENLYKKNVEFNIINIKRFYLNSDILSESITNKLARNRRKMLRYLKKLRNKVVIKEKRDFFKDEKWSKQTLNRDPNLSRKKVLLQKYIINNLKYKHVTGYRLEAKGRLSKRFTASRSVSKLSYKGNLLDFYSSYKGISSVLLKGNLKSNRQYTLLKSKSRIGSFGIKGWVGGN